MTYGYTKELHVPFAEALTKVKSALETAGFGLPVEMNAQEILKNKIDKDIGPYYIIGACDPLSAYHAIEAEKEIGLLLPCNVLLYERDGKVFVAAIKPTVAMHMVDNQTVQTIAQNVEERLQQVIESL